MPVLLIPELLLLCLRAPPLNDAVDRQPKYCYDPGAVLVTRALSAIKWKANSHLMLTFHAQILIADVYCKVEDALMIGKFMRIGNKRTDNAQLIEGYQICKAVSSHIIHFAETPVLT